MEKIGLNNEMYFYVMCGMKPAVPDFIYTMKSEVNPDILRDALRLVLKRFHYLRQRPVVDDDGNLWLEQNDALPEVYPYGEKTVKLGTDESNGYLFRISCANSDICVSIFHGLADGRAMNNFALSLIRQYLILSGEKIDAEDMVITPESKEDPSERDDFFKKCLELYKECEGEVNIKAPEEVFVIPGKRQYYDLNSSRCFEISYKADEYKDACKAAGASALTFMQAVITEAICRMYDVSGKAVTFNVPVDLRGMALSRSQANFTTNISIQYREGEGNSFEEMIRVFEAQMDDRVKLKYLLANVKETEEGLKGLTAIPLNDRQKIEKLHDDLKVNTVGGSTMLLSNIGVIKMPKDLAEHIKGFRLVSVNLAYAPDFYMVTMGDTGRLFIGQNYEDTGLLECMIKVFSEHGVTAELKDNETISAYPVLPYLFGRVQVTE